MGQQERATTDELELAADRGVQADMCTPRGDQGGSGNYFQAFSRVLLPWNGQDPASPGCTQNAGPEAERWGAGVHLQGAGGQRGGRPGAPAWWQSTENFQS